MSARISNLRALELLLLITGLLLVVFAVSTYLGGRIYSRGSIAIFHSGSASQAVSSPYGVDNFLNVDFSLWSPKRIEHYRASLAGQFDRPLAILRLDKIHLEVPVFEGTSDRVLNRGVGRIDGTARIGESGNVGIAGHRDGFFRGLKDISVGDTMELETTSAKQLYLIDSINLVDRDDLSVLRNRSASELTLVTCYPFYFIGSAPQRYIVHASLKGANKTLHEPDKASLQATASRTKESTQ